MLQGFNHLFSDRFALSYLLLHVRHLKEVLHFPQNSSDKHNIVLKKKKKNATLTHLVFVVLVLLLFLLFWDWKFVLASLRIPYGVFHTYLVLVDPSSTPAWYAMDSLRLSETVK